MRGECNRLQDARLSCVQKIRRTRAMLSALDGSHGSPFCVFPLSPSSFVLAQMLISILYSAVIIGLGTSQLIDMQAAKSEADFKAKEQARIEAEIAERDARAAATAAAAQDGRRRPTQAQQQHQPQYSQV
jgi:prefoldin subunit 5